jgi:hypothetical protein
MNTGAAYTARDPQSGSGVGRAMKVCPHCGDSYRDHVDFCFGDGEVLILVEVAAATTSGADLDPPTPRSSTSSRMQGGQSAWPAESKSTPTPAPSPEGPLAEGEWETPSYLQEGYLQQPYAQPHAPGDAPSAEGESQIAGANLTADAAHALTSAQAGDELGDEELPTPSGEYDGDVTMPLPVDRSQRTNTAQLGAQASQSPSFEAQGQPGEAGGADPESADSARGSALGDPPELGELGPDPRWSGSEGIATTPAPAMSGATVPGATVSGVTAPAPPPSQLKGRGPIVNIAAPPTQPVLMPPSLTRETPAPEAEPRSAAEALASDETKPMPLPERPTLPHPLPSQITTPVGAEPREQMRVAPTPAQLHQTPSGSPGLTNTPTPTPGLAPSLSSQDTAPMPKPQRPRPPQVSVSTNRDPHRGGGVAIAVDPLDRTSPDRANWWMFGVVFAVGVMFAVVGAGIVVMAMLVQAKWADTISPVTDTPTALPSPSPAPVEPVPVEPAPVVIPVEPAPVESPKIQVGTVPAPAPPAPPLPEPPLPGPADNVQPKPAPPGPQPGVIEPEPKPTPEPAAPAVPAKRSVRVGALPPDTLITDGNEVFTRTGDTIEMKEGEHSLTFSRDGGGVESIVVPCTVRSDGATCLPKINVRAVSAPFGHEVYVNGTLIPEKGLKLSLGWHVFEVKDKDTKALLHTEKRLVNRDEISPKNSTQSMVLELPAAPAPVPAPVP